jgi:hypothetical protein
MRAVVIDASDNVATVTAAVAKGEAVTLPDGGQLVSRDPVAEGHKIALVAIARGEVVRKYGHPIGTAARDIAPGEHVHTHNLARAGWEAEAGGN